jgi:hypothetical protein
MMLNQLTIFRPVIYSDNQFKLTNTVCGGSPEVINIKSDDANDCQCPLIC